MNICLAQIQGVENKISWEAPKGIKLQKNPKHLNAYSLENMILDKR